MAEVVAVARALLAVEVEVEVGAEEVAEDTEGGAEDLHRPVASPLGLPSSRA